MTRNDFHGDGDTTPALLDPPPGPLTECPAGVGPDEARAMLAAAVLGLPLGDFDRRTLAYLAAGDVHAVTALASIIHRARMEDPR